jgi:competence protein ComEA
MDLLNDRSVKKLIKLAKKFQTSLILALIGLALIGAGLSTSKLVSLGQKPQFIESEASSGEEEITIDVSGAVKKPGVYRFSVGTRAIEAIEKAGGFSKKADNDWIAKNLNLASKLADGEKVFIPAKGSSNPIQTTTGSVSGEVSGKININTASESELDTLYGIGPVRAGKIIANRPYTSVEDLLTKKVLGEATFEKIKDKISVF